MIYFQPKGKVCQQRFSVHCLVLGECTVSSVIRELLNNNRSQNPLCSFPGQNYSCKKEATEGHEGQRAGWGAMGRSSEQLLGRRIWAFPAGDLEGLLASPGPHPPLPSTLWLLDDEAKFRIHPPANSHASFRVIDRGCLERRDVRQGW